MEITTVFHIPAILMGPTTTSKSTVTLRRRSRRASATILGIGDSKRAKFHMLGDLFRCTNVVWVTSYFLNLEMGPLICHISSPAAVPGPPSQPQAQTRSQLDEEFTYHVGDLLHVCAYNLIFSVH